MATESRSRFENVTAPGLFAVASEEFKRYPEVWKEWVSIRTSKKAYEESGYVSGYGYLFEKPEGTPVSYDARIQGPVKRWVHKTFALGCRITEECIEDDDIGIMKRATKDLSTAAKATRHLLATRMLMNANATTYHTAGDGFAICYGSHVKLGGGTWDNLGDAADPSEASLEAAIKNFEAITDDRGKKYDQKANAIVCGPTWEFKIAKLLGSDLEPETNNNAINAVAKRRKLKLVIDPEITDGRWFLLGEKDSDVGIIWFDRKKPTMSKHGDPDTGDSKFMVRFRYSLECNDPRQIYMVPAFS
jgi:phage major head subunit gpT-like protein